MQHFRIRSGTNFYFRKVVWGRWAQVTNNPENDGCVNALLLV